MKPRVLAAVGIAFTAGYAVFIFFDGPRRVSALVERVKEGFR